MRLLPLCLLAALLPAAGVSGASVTLTAKDAAVTGGVAYFPQGDFIGAWRDPKAFLKWQLTVDEESTANVTLTQGCAPDCGGKFRLEIGTNVLSGQSKPTGGWGTMETVPLGSLKLGAGKYTATLRAEGPLKSGLMNLKEIRLEPLKGSAAKFVPPPVPLPKQVFIVPNFHPASCGWLANFSEERNYCANNYLLHLDRVRDDRNYALVVSEVNNMIAILNFTPERFAEMQRFIKEGRVEPVNAFFLEPTVNLSGGETLAKMGIEGLRWQEKMFGVRPRYCWAIDTCGMHDQMPQLCAQLGLDALVYNRCARSTNAVFWSESPDGSRILTLSAGSYANNLAGLFSGLTAPDERTVRGVAGTISTKKPTTPAGAPAFIPGGHGDYSQPPKWPGNPSAFLELWRKFRPDCDLRFTGLSAYVDTLLPLLKSGKVQVESLRAGTGYAYGSFWLNAPEMKAWYRRDEHSLQAAEMAATAASLKAGFTYPTQTFYHAWLQMLLNSDRNSLWGDGAGKVYEDPDSWDIKDRLTWVGKESTSATDDAIRKLTGEGTQTALFNPLNWQRSDFPALPSCGIGPAPAEPTFRDIPLPATIETPFYSAKVDPQSGAITSLKTKPSGREMLGGPANVILADRQPPKGSSDSTNPRPKRTRWAEFGGFTNTVTASESADAVVVQAAGTSSTGIPVTRRMTFSRTTPRIECTTTVSDIPDKILVYAEFPLAQAPKEIRRGIPFGFSRDDNFVQGITPTIRWSDYSTPGQGGVALLDRGLPGREVNGNVPVIHLFNAFEKYSGYPSPWTSGKGEHTFRYAIFAHDDDWPAARIPQQAWEFNSPPLAVSGCAQATPGSFLTTSGNLVVEAMRREGADIELRLVEWTGTAGNAEVTLNLPHEGARMTDMVGGHAEKLEGGPTYRFPVKPQQIITLRFKTAQPVAEIATLTKWDELVPEKKRPALNLHKPELKGHPPHDVDLQVDQGNQANK